MIYPQKSRRKNHVSECYLSRKQKFFLSLFCTKVIHWEAQTTGDHEGEHLGALWILFILWSSINRLDLLGACYGEGSLESFASVSSVTQDHIMERHCSQRYSEMEEVVTVRWGQWPAGAMQSLRVRSWVCTRLHSGRTELCREQGGVSFTHSHCL